MWYCTLLFKLHTHNLSFIILFWKHSLWSLIKSCVFLGSVPVSTERLKFSVSRFLTMILRKLICPKSAKSIFSLDGVLFSSFWCIAWACKEGSCSLLGGQESSSSLFPLTCLPLGNASNQSSPYEFFLNWLFSWQEAMPVAFVVAPPPALLPNFSARLAYCNCSAG